MQRPRNDRRFPPLGVKPMPSYRCTLYKAGADHLNGSPFRQPQRFTLRGQSPRCCGPRLSRNAASDAEQHGFPASVVTWRCEAAPRPFPPRPARRRAAREAARWYRKAAEQGVASAQGQLGFMYARGEGVGKDYVKAYAWASLAAAQREEMPVTPKVLGIEGKETTLKAWLREQMTAQHIDKAQSLSAKLFNRIESSKAK